MMSFLSRYDPKSIFTKLTALPSQQRVFGLDLMRAVAILAVLLTHAQLVLPPAFRAYILYPASVGGVLGVELFFVLSGFLIGSILLSLAPSFDNIRILPYFWQRRWFRTLPNYFLFLALSIVAFLFLPKEMPNILLYLTFTQNLLWPHPDLFAPAWSLSVEEWFYLLFPASLFLIYRLSKSFTTAFLLSAIIFIVIPTLIRIQWALASAGISNWDESFRKVMFIRLDAIMYGVLAAWVKKRFPLGWAKSRFLLSIIGLLIVFFSWSFATQQGLNSSFFAKTFLFSFVSLGFACMLPLCDQWEISKENRVTRSLRLIALWSYSLYLCNILVAQVFLLAQQKIGRTPLFLDITFFILFYVFSLVLSSMVYTYFEKPVMDLRDKFSKADSLAHPRA